MKIYFVRHQAGGVQWDCPFFGPPSPDQIMAMDARLVAIYGEKHSKTGEAYWATIIGVDVLNDGDLPPLPPARDDSIPRGARIGEPPVELSGTAIVTNPTE